MTLRSVSLLVFVCFLFVCLICTFLLGLFACFFDKVVTLALIFFINGRKWKFLIPLESRKTKCRTFSLTSFLLYETISNSLTTIIAFNVQNKKVYTWIILQELWLKPLISQRLTNVQEIFLFMWILNVPTPLNHIYVYASLDTLEMDKLAQVILSFKISFLQSQLFKEKSNLKRPFNSNYGARNNETFILKCSSTP